APDPEAFDEFVEAWFFDKVVPEYQLSDARAATGAAAPDEAWFVTATIENRGTGRMPVEIAATRGTRFDDDGAPNPDYRESRVTITIGPEELADLTIPCDFEPDGVIVDPDALVLQLNRETAIVRF
ncbi:MAG: hypothetical protein ACYSU7_12985, partial [Planctomycetota bacterium]